MTQDIDSKSKPSSPQRQELKVVMASQCISDRKLPRTPDEYAKRRKTRATMSTQGLELELVMADRCINIKPPLTPGKGTALIRKMHASVSPMNANNEMASIASNSNSKCPAFTNQPESRPLVGRKDKQLEPSRILLGPRALDNDSDSTHTDFSEYNDGTSRCGPCMSLSSITPNYVIQWNTLSDEFSLSACPATSSDITESGYEKLNPETMECLHGYGITTNSQDHINRRTF